MSGCGHRQGEKRARDTRFRHTCLACFEFILCEPEITMYCLEAYKERKLCKLQLSHQSTVLSLCYLIVTNEYIYTNIVSKF